MVLIVISFSVESIVLLHKFFPKYVCSAEYGCFLEFLDFMFSWYFAHVLLLLLLLLLLYFYCWYLGHYWMNPLLTLSIHIHPFKCQGSAMAEALFSLNIHLGELVFPVMMKTMYI